MSEGLKIGDLVWAKMKGFSPWPAKVAKPLSHMKRPKSSKVLHCIYFFGSNNFAWIEEYNIKPYIIFKEQLSKACKTVLFKQACAAIEDFIARKEAGEDVEKAFEESQEQNQNEPQESTEQDDGTLTDVQTDDEGPTKVGKKRRATNESTKEKSEYDPSVTIPRKKKLLSENGESSKSITPREKIASRKRRQSGSSVKDSTSTSSTKKAASTKASNHVRKSAAASFLDRPSASSRPDATPLNVGDVSQTLKDKKITPSTLRFGFLGLGIMGSGMVKNLIHSGHKVVVWNRTPDKCKDFLEAGADQGMTPSDVVSSADITFACVADPQAAKDMVFGNCGVLQEMTASKAYVEMTGTDTESSQDVADAISIKGGRYLEAQVQGSKTEAEEGTLVILAAGDRSLYEDCQSTFQAIGKHSFFLGDVGNASKMNLVLQLINGVVLGGLAEGMALADRAMLEQKDVLEIINLTSLSCSLVRDKVNAIMEGNFPAHQPLQHMQKDLNLALNMGHMLEQPLPLAASANEVFKHAKRLGYGDHDAAAVYIRARF